MTDPKHKMTIRISRELHKAAKVKAVESEIALSEVVRQFLTLWIEGKIELPVKSKGGQPEQNE